MVLNGSVQCSTADCSIRVELTALFSYTQLTALLQHLNLIAKNENFIQVYNKHAGSDGKC